MVYNTTHPQPHPVCTIQSVLSVLYRHVQYVDFDKGGGVRKIIEKVEVNSSHEGPKIPT
jgi:hypothetical protein